MINLGVVFEEIVISEASVKGVLMVRQYVETGFGGDGRIYLKGNAWPDFIGSMQGLAFIFDCKRTNNKNKTTMEQGRSAKNRILEQLQFNRLVEAWELGTVSFYLVLWAFYMEVEMFMVDGKSEWPFIASRGKGIPLGPLVDGNWFDQMTTEVARAYDHR